MESRDFYEFVTILASDFFIVLFLFGATIKRTNFQKL